MSVFTDEQFVRKWAEAYQKQLNQSWVADELEVTRQAVETRKQHLAKLGVKFPLLPRTRPRVPLHIDSLNKILKEAVSPTSSPDGDRKDGDA